MHVGMSRICLVILLGSVACGPDLNTSPEARTQSLTAPLPVLRSVTSLSRRDSWAVGAAGTALHYDGHGWSVVPTSTTADLNKVSGSDGENLWAVGTGGTTLRFGSGRWTLLPSGTTEELYGVWTNGKEEAWAVGAAGTILRWRHRAWTLTPSGTTSDLRGVWSSAPNDVWAVGDGGTILHWRHGAWSPVDSGTTSALQAIYGTGPRDIWAVGGPSGGYGRAVHYDGHSWTQQTVGPSGRNALDFADVWGSSPRRYFAVAHSWRSTTVLGWDGTQWSESFTETSYMPTRWYWGVSGHKADLFVAGAEDAAGRLLRWDGSAWAEELLP